MSLKNCPIIIGAAQFTQPKETEKPLDPLSLIAKVSKLAIRDTGIKNLNEYIDAVYVVYFRTWSYEDAPSELSEMVGIKPSNKLFSSAGGNTSQSLINQVAINITEGKSKLVLITGAEAWYSTSRARKNKLVLNWPKRKESKIKEGGFWKDLNEFENNYRLFIPSISYALFETALRAASGRSLEEHQHHIGKLFEHFIKIASKNPYAWLKEPYSAQEIITPTAKNRNVNHPYTKFMCSNPFTDQAGAILLTAQEYAKELNINPRKWVYPMGGADLQNIFNITQRPNLINSPAVKHASHLALSQAGLKIEDINLFDLYSCFPSMVQIILNELEIKEQDPRPLTITGGLPFFGGPWNNYSLHPVITAVDLVRENPSLKIMVVANGGYNTKQSVGIYGKEPPTKPWGLSEVSEIQKEILKGELAKPVEIANGTLTIEAYTVIYGRNGIPNGGIVIGNLANGARTLAHIKGDGKKLEELIQEELVGKKFNVYHDYKTKSNIIKINNYILNKNTDF
ncbi:MAG: hypothetical protein ACFE94_15725 [Candidatus Hodarchaeota archaeon]